MSRAAHSLLLICLLLASSLFYLQPTSGLEQPILYVFKPPPLKIVDVEGYQLPIVETFYLGGPPGAPILPSKTYTFLLPPNAELSTVKLIVIELKRHALKGCYEIPPAPPFLPGDVAPPRVSVGTPNMEIYGRNALYPKSPVSIVAKGQVREAKLVKVEFTPVQYNPVEKKLYFVERAVVKIVFKTSPELPSALPPITVKMLKELGFNKVNKGDIKLYEQKAVAPQFGEGYLIVTTNDVEANSQVLDDFKSFLEARGFNVYIITENDYGYAEGQQRAINIRNWIKDHYQALNIKYVLFIGNPDPDAPLKDQDSFGDAPMMMCYPLGTSYPCPTDYFYADLTGSWDADGDGIYGEYPDDASGIDLYPEVLVGRIPVYSGDYRQLDYILNKTMNFNRLRGPWLYRALLPMAISNYENEDNHGWNRTDGRELPKYLIEKVLIPTSSRTPVPFRWCVFYEREGLRPVPENASYFNTSLSSQHVISEWQKGYGIVFCWGHGNPTGVYRKIWVSDDGDGVPESGEMLWKPLVTSSNASLLSDETPSIVYQAACLNGCPEDSENLGYSLLKRGAIATVTSSGVSWYEAGTWWINYWPDNAEIGYRYIENLLKFMPLGAALYAAKAELYRNATIIGQYVDAALMNLMDFNLYGDPSLQPYKPVKPKVIRVDNDLEECPDAEYTHISDAIAAALSSDIILVYPGTYFEPTMVVDKPLKIASAMEERPIVRVFSTLPVFTIHGASKVTVDGLVIRGGGCCIAVNACSDVVISHCSFNAPQGVLVADSRMVLIDGCKALSIDEGISVINSSIVLLVNCLLQNCSKHGVLLNRSSLCLVAGLNFTGCCYGLHVD